MFNFEHSESLTKIAPALASLQESIRAIELSGRNEFGKYDYMKEEDLIFKLRPLLSANDLSFLKTLVSVECLPPGRETDKGKAIYPVRVVLCGMLLHKSGEWVKFYSAGDGQDGGDKGIYKALTGASKYLIAKGFGFPTGDDPEAGDGDEGGSEEATTEKKSDKGKGTGAQQKKKDADKPTTGYQVFLKTMDEHEQRLGTKKYRGILKANNYEFASDIKETDEAEQQAIHKVLKGIK